MGKFAVLIPERIHIEEITNVNPSLQADYLRYCISSVILKQGYKIEEQHLNKSTNYPNSSNDNYVPIKPISTGSQYQKYKQACEYLCQNNFETRKSRSTTKNISILNRKKYVVNESPFTYRLDSHFKNAKLKIEYIIDKNIIDKSKEDLSKLDSIFKRGTYQFLHKYFNPTKLEIDLEGAKELCDDRFRSHKDYNKYIRELTQIVFIYNGTYRLSYVSNSTGRLYTNLTQLPKVYRRFITYNNEKLVEVDISNSVIFFLSLIINNTINSTSLNNILISNINNISSNSTSTLLMFSKSLENLSKKEIELIQEYSKEGNFYDLFVDDFEENFTSEEMKSLFENESNETYVGSFHQKRKVCKKQILAMLFAEPHQYEDIQEIFKLKFPELLEKLNAFKLEYGYKKLSFLLFQLESLFVLDIVARKFNKKYCKKAPIFTLHDCLITTEDYGNNLQICLNDSMNEILGCAPKTKIEKFN